MPKGKKPPAAVVDDSSDGDEEAGAAISAAGAGNLQIAHALANNPALMEAVQNKLNGLVGKTSGYVETLPEPVKKRLNALKNLQVEYANIEGQFYQDVHALEVKYSELFKPIYEKRKLIVNGDYEPTEEETTWVEPGEDEDGEDGEDDEEKKEGEQKDDDDKSKEDGENKETKVKEVQSEADKLAEELEDKATVNDTESKEEDVKGINEFWLTAMKNVDMINEMVQPHDEPILSHLTDVKLLFSGKKEAADESSDDELGFAIEFHFSANDHFSNSVLTKSYKIQCEPDKDDPFSFEGTEIIGCTGCNIDWKKGKNVTQKTIKKKQKHKGRGQTRTVTKTVQNDSFFNFFAPPEVDEDDEMEEDTEALLAADFEIGHFFRERLIPKAVLYFTGEAIDDDEDDDEYEDDDGDEGDDEELDEEDDPDFVPPADGEKPPECKQQ